MLNWFRLGFGSAHSLTSQWIHLNWRRSTLEKSSTVTSGRFLGDRKCGQSSFHHESTTNKHADRQQQTLKRRDGSVTSLPAFQGSTSCSRDHKELVWSWCGSTNPWIYKSLDN